MAGRETLKFILGLTAWACGLLCFRCSESTDTIYNPAPDQSYVIDSIVMPTGLSGEVGALEFSPSGKLIAAVGWGEVMMYDPETKAWTVFARGLHLPLGLSVGSEAEVLVMQYAGLTRLVDTDLDGEADVYENVTDDFGLGGNYHEFAYGPVED